MDNLNFSFPFQKVDKQRRIVTGIATADNIDPTGDIVEAEASREAFNNWVGNIREMHGKEAVGRAVDYKPIMIHKDGQTYNGIEVSAYISRGAPNAWEKILDKTYKGFSIGGEVREKSFEFNKATGKNVRRVHKYDLGELSIVDNPANPIAQFSMVKRAEDGTLTIESKEDQHIIYYCEDHKIAKADNTACTNCDVPMKEIGFTANFEIEEINKMIEDYEFQKVTNAHKSPPKGYPSDKSDYADPENFKYPIDSEHVVAAMDYYNHDGQQSKGGYSDSQWAAIGERIVSALNRLKGGGYSLKDGKIMSKDNVEKAKTSDKEDAEDAKDGGADESSENEGNEDSAECPNCGKDMKKGAELCKACADDNMKKNLQNNNTNDSVNDMDLTDTQKFGLLRKFVTWVSGEDVTPAIPEIVEKAVVVETKETEAVDSAVEEVSTDDQIEKNGGSEEVDIKDLMGQFSTMLDEKLTTVKEEIEKSVDSKITEKVEAITKSVEATNEKVNEIDEKTAIKKSVDETGEQSETKIEKSTESFWGGIFVPKGIVDVLGYES